jgi:hypothetical protein
MQLSKVTMRYLCDEFENKISHSSFDEICDKIDTSYDSVPGGMINKKNKLFGFFSNLNNTPKLAEAISVLFLDFSGPLHLQRLNDILKRDGYNITEDGKIISYMGEQVQLATTQSKIEKTLHDLSFNRVLTLFDQGIDEYGRNQEFQTLRTAIIGLIEEILRKENLPITGNIRTDMNKLFDINILNNNCRPFTIGVQTDHLELVHAYGIFSLLSEYLVHYGDLNEEEKHFIFFQSVGLFWLLTERYKKYLETKP